MEVIFMSQSVISVRVEDSIKQRFDAFCSDAGMNASVAINIFVRAVLKENCIPFVIKGNDDPFYSEKTQSRINQAIERLEAGLGTEHELIEDDE
jgi:DNA-damage-inducible protein J